MTFHESSYGRFRITGGLRPSSCTGLSLSDLADRLVDIGMPWTRPAPGFAIPGPATPGRCRSDNGAWPRKRAHRRPPTAAAYSRSEGVSRRCRHTQGLRHDQGSDRHSSDHIAPQTTPMRCRPGTKPDLKALTLRVRERPAAQHLELAVRTGFRILAASLLGLAPWATAGQTPTSVNWAVPHPLRVMQLPRRRSTIGPTHGDDRATSRFAAPNRNWVGGDWRRSFERSSNADRQAEHPSDLGRRHRLV
ncbi:MAG: hypothetical protein JWN06_1556 [Propionibacteriaceae bacterium]|jgi:hypothetical protein|nr:hypothetical protein [Propionibacteriaceae bacterium]